MKLDWEEIHHQFLIGNPSAFATLLMLVMQHFKISTLTLPQAVTAELAAQTLALRLDEQGNMVVELVARERVASLMAKAQGGAVHHQNDGIIIRHPDEPEKT